MGNRHHSHILTIDGAEVERVSGDAGKSYYCRMCSTDRCRHVKRAREGDLLHLRQEEERNARRG